nr:spore coat protein U domain-containing protein [Variovorax boronicumulans]
MRRTVTRIALAALSTAAVLAAPQAIAAGSLAGQLNAQMTLQAGCIVSGAPGAGSTGVNFGALDFGTQPATFTGILAATASGGAGGAGATQILCSPDVTSLSITVSGGNNAGQGGSVGVGSRAMKLGTSNYLPYEVYSDVGMTNAYPTSASAVGVTLPGTGVALPLPIYGRINKTSAAALVSGTYTDVLQVTLAW